MALQYWECVVGHIRVAIVEAQPDDAVAVSAGLSGHGLLDVPGDQTLVCQAVHLGGEALRGHSQLVVPVGDPVVEEDAQPGTCLPRAELPLKGPRPGERRLRAQDGNRAESEVTACHRTEKRVAA